MVFDVATLSQKHIVLLAVSGLFFFTVMMILVYSFYQIRKHVKEGLFEEAQIHFSFLVLGYKKEFYNWSWFIWIRDLLVRGVIIEIWIVQNHEMITFLLYFMVIISVIHIFLQMTKKPFEYTSLNKIENVDLLMEILIGIAMCILNQNFSTWISAASLVFVIVLALTVSLYWILQYYVDEKFSKEEEQSYLVRTVYALRRVFKIKYKQYRGFPIFSTNINRDPKRTGGLCLLRRDQ
jgi:hypothetical protein